MAENELTVREQRMLQHHEQEITRNLGNAYNSLKLIHDQKLYRGAYPTFEDYCRTRWKMSDRHARNLLKHGQILLAIEEAGDPKTEPMVPKILERHTREVADLPPEEGAKIIMDTVKRTDGKITAEAVRETREGDPFGTDSEGSDADPFGDEPISPEGEEANTEDSSPRPPGSGTDKSGGSKPDPLKAFKTQKAKTIKTAEALMRAFDDLHRLHKNKADHESSIVWCKQLLVKAREWE